MKSSNRRIAKGAAAAALTALAYAGVAFAQSWPGAWTTPTPGFRIIDNVYWVGTEGLASYLITSPKGHILIDAGVAADAPLIEKNIAALGFRLKDVKVLLNSHAHFDHSGGLAQIKKDSGATLIASAGDRSALEGGFYLGSESNHAFDAPPVKVDSLIAEGQSVALGGVTLTAHLTPGHTRGCTSYSFVVHDAGRALNALVFCSATVAANRLVGRPQYPGIVSDYLATFAKARAMRVDVFLAPHPEFFAMAQKRAKRAPGAANPFVDPSEFPAFIDRAEAEFKLQLAAQESALHAKAIP
jgi:metallo-beta-lactamase class B